MCPAIAIGDDRSADVGTSGLQGDDCGVGGGGITVGSAFFAGIYRGSAAPRGGDVRFWNRQGAGAFVDLGRGFSLRIERANYAEFALCLSRRVLRHGIFVHRAARRERQDAMRKRFELRGWDM